MAIWDPPWMQGGNYTGKEDRFGSMAELWDEGVNDRTALKVTQRALGANMTVDVAAGDAIVQGDDQPAQGNYGFRNDALFNLTGFVATTGSNVRYDLVVARINDPDGGGAAGNSGTIERVAGTAAVVGSAVPPAVPNSCLLRAVVGPFTASTSSITSGMIYDCWSTGVPAAAAATAAVAGLLRGFRKAPGSIEQTINAVAPNGWAIMAAQTLAVSGVGAKLAEHLPGSVSGGNVTVPDGRGRMLVSMDSQGGTDAGRLSSGNTILAAGGAETVTLTTTTMPSHSHGGNTGYQSTDHVHGQGPMTGSGITDVQGFHDHYSSGSSAVNVLGAVAGGLGLAGGGAVEVGFYSTVSGNGAHQHNFGVTVSGGTTGGMNVSHYHGINPEGSGGAHDNMPPFLTVYTIIRL